MRQVIPLIFISVWMAYTQPISAEPQTEDPRLEIGLGGSGYRMQSRPDWAAKYYGTGIITSSVRVYRGFSFEVGREFGYGQEPRPDWLDYGENFRLKTHKGTYTVLSWLGVRYEVPMSAINIDFMGIHFICTSLGMMYSKYGIRSNTWEKDDIIEKGKQLKNYRFANVSGPYASLAARWRIDTDVSQNTGSWLGAYGFEIGVRYIRFTHSAIRHDNIMKPNSAFNSFQVFIIGFLKIGFLY